MVNLSVTPWSLMTKCKTQGFNSYIPILIILLCHFYCLYFLSLYSQFLHCWNSILLIYNLYFFNFPLGMFYQWLKFAWTSQLLQNGSTSLAASNKIFKPFQPYFLKLIVLVNFMILIIKRNENWSFKMLYHNRQANVSYQVKVLNTFKS